MDEQKEIAAVLDKVSGLIALRKKQLQKLDELVKARFVEMFGDPERNPCGWPVKKLDVVVASITAGWSANGEARPKKAGEKAVLKVSAVTQGFFKSFLRHPFRCSLLSFVARLTMTLLYDAQNKSSTH